MVGSHTCESNPNHPFYRIHRAGPMRYALLALILVLTLPCASPSMWGYIPLDELVQDSDLIVAGTLHDVREHSSRGTDFGTVLIAVDKVLWGGTRSTAICSP